MKKLKKTLKSADLKVLQLDQLKTQSCLSVWEKKFVYQLDLQLLQSKPITAHQQFILQRIQNKVNQQKGTP